MQIASVLGRALAVYRDHWRPLIGMAAGVWVASAVLALLVAVAIAVTTGAFFLTAGLAQGARVAAILSGLGAVAVELLAQVLLGGMYVVACEDLRDGRQDRSIQEYLAVARPKLGPLLLTGVLSGLGVALGLALLVVPGVVFAVRWSCASAVVMVEGRSGRDALRRSRAIVAGNGWPMLGLLLAMLVLVGLATAGVDAVGGSLLGREGPAIALVRTIAGFVITPFTAIAPVIAYYDLTARWRPPASPPAA